MMANLNFQQPPRSIANSFSSSSNSSNNISSSRNQFIQNQTSTGSTASNNNNSLSSNSNSNPVGGEFPRILFEHFADSLGPNTRLTLNPLPPVCPVISSLMASSANNPLAQQQSASSLVSSAGQNNNNSSSSLSGHVTPTSAMFNGGSGGGSGVGGIGSDRSQQQQQMPIGGPNNPQGSVQGGQNNSLLGYRSFPMFSQVNARSSSMVSELRRFPAEEDSLTLLSLQPNNSNMSKSILNRTTAGPFGLVGGGGSGGLQSYQSVFGGIGGELQANLKMWETDGDC